MNMILALKLYRKNIFLSMESNTLYFDFQYDADKLTKNQLKSVVMFIQAFRKLELMWQMPQTKLVISDKFKSWLYSIPGKPWKFDKQYDTMSDLKLKALKNRIILPADAYYIPTEKTIKSLRKNKNLNISDFYSNKCFNEFFEYYIVNIGFTFGKFLAMKKCQNQTNNSDNIYIFNKSQFNRKLFLQNYAWRNRFTHRVFETDKSVQPSANMNLVIWSDAIAKQPGFLQKEFSQFINAYGNIEYPIFIVESGFVNSVDLFKPTNTQEYNDKWCMPVSYIMAYAQHYDYTIGTMMPMAMMYLTFKYCTLNPVQYQRALNAINFILKNKISKYNNQLKEFPKPNNDKKNILIVDQTYGDQSIQLEEDTAIVFQRMLDTAIEENSDCNIFLKIHPEQLVGRRLGFYTTNKDDIKPGQVYINREKYPQVHFITDFYNPIDLLSKMDKVYTVSSQIGFEALLFRKSVITFGMPFYAGYGFTDDRCTDEKFVEIKAYIERSPIKVKSIVEMFYQLYIRLTHYVNPDTGALIELEDALNLILQKRNEFKVIK